MERLAELNHQVSATASRGRHIHALRLPYRSGVRAGILVGYRVAIRALAARATAGMNDQVLNRVRVDALPTHGFVRESWGIGPSAPGDRSLHAATTKKHGSVFCYSEEGVAIEPTNHTS
jgi:hypothetical protein